MIEPVLKDGPLLADMAAARAEASETLHAWWLGQSGFWLECAGESLLLDPYLSDSLTKKYASTDKPHVRMTSRCVAPEMLKGVKLVTASHLHTDHLDAETLRPLAEANNGIDLLLPHPIIEEARARLGDAPVALQGLDAGGTVSSHGWQITGVPAAHNELKRDAAGRCHYLGFLIRRAGFTVYHSGDTLWHEEMQAALQAAGGIDLMLLPINGNRPERRVAGNLNGTEATKLAKSCGARLVVPCHYEMFEFNTESLDLFIRSCVEMEQEFRVLRCGERLTLPL